MKFKCAIVVGFFILTIHQVLSNNVENTNVDKILSMKTTKISKPAVVSCEKLLNNTLGDLTSLVKRHIYVTKEIQNFKKTGSLSYQNILNIIEKNPDVIWLRELCATLSDTFWSIRKRTQCEEQFNGKIKIFAESLDKETEGKLADVERALTETDTRLHLIVYDLSRNYQRYLRNCAKDNVGIEILRRYNESMREDNISVERGFHLEKEFKEKIQKAIKDSLMPSVKQCLDHF